MSRLNDVRLHNTSDPTRLSNFTFGEVRVQKAIVSIGELGFPNGARRDELEARVQERYPNFVGPIGNVYPADGGRSPYGDQDPRIVYDAKCDILLIRRDTDSTYNPSRENIPIPGRPSRLVSGIRRGRLG